MIALLLFIFAAFFVCSSSSSPLSPIRFYKTSNGLVFCTNSSTLTVRARDSKAKISTSSSVIPPPDTSQPIDAIYGIYPLPKSKRVAVAIVASSEVVFNHDLYKGDSIRRAQDISLICVPTVANATKFDSEELSHLKLLKKTFKSHDLFFCRSDEGLSSSGCDVTHTFQRALSHSPPTPANSSSSSLPPDPRFFWNSEISSSLPEEFQTPFCSCFVNKIEAPAFTQVLISRRSQHRSGVRFIMRGSDDSGNVANFVESEQIILQDDGDKVSSHVQIRGSIPLRWSSPALLSTRNPPVEINLDTQAQISTLSKHIGAMLQQYESAPYITHRDYPTLTFVNLIDKATGDQSRLGETFAETLSSVTSSSSEEANLSNRVRHVWFDYHAEVKKMGVDRLGKNRGGLLSLNRGEFKVGRDLMRQGIFRITRDPYCDGSFVIEEKQNGVIRTNCMDCLDRTNVVQSFIARDVALRCLSLSRFHDDDNNTVNFMSSEGKNRLSRNRARELALHRALWADNADALSKLYAGTRALKGDVTRTGVRTVKGSVDDGINSMKRYVGNNFLDGERQMGVDYLRGAPPTGSVFSGINIGKKLNINEDVIFRVQKPPLELDLSLVDVDESEEDEDEDDDDDDDDDGNCVVKIDIDYDEEDDTGNSGKNNKDFLLMAVAALAAGFDAAERPPLLGLAGCLAVGRLIVKTIRGVLNGDLT